MCVYIVYLHTYTCTYKHRVKLDDNPLTDFYFCLWTCILNLNVYPLLDLFFCSFSVPQRILLVPVPIFHNPISALSNCYYVRDLFLRFLFHS